MSGDAKDSPQAILPKIQVGAHLAVICAFAVGLWWLRLDFLPNQLRHADQSPDPYTAAYRKSLNDAIDDFTDALDGATKALSDQVKLFGELKREEKADAQAVKDRAHEEKKRTKEEVKLRHKEHEKGPPTDPDED